MLTDTIQLLSIPVSPIVSKSATTIVGQDVINEGRKGKVSGVNGGFGDYYPSLRLRLRDPCVA